MTRQCRGCRSDGRGPRARRTATGALSGGTHSDLLTCGLLILIIGTYLPRFGDRKLHYVSPAQTPVLSRLLTRQDALERTICGSFPLRLPADPQPRPWSGSQDPALRPSILVVAGCGLRGVSRHADVPTPGRSSGRLATARWLPRVDVRVLLVIRQIHRSRSWSCSRARSCHAARRGPRSSPSGCHAASCRAYCSAGSRPSGGPADPQGTGR